MCTGRALNKAYINGYMGIYFRVPIVIQTKYVKIISCQPECTNRPKSEVDQKFCPELYEEKNFLMTSLCGHLCNCIYVNQMGCELFTFKLYESILPVYTHKSVSTYKSSPYTIGCGGSLSALLQTLWRRPVWRGLWAPHGGDGSHADRRQPKVSPH